MRRDTRPSVAAGRPHAVRFLARGRNSRTPPHARPRRGSSAGICTVHAGLARRRRDAGAFLVGAQRVADLTCGVVVTEGTSVRGRGQARSASRPPPEWSVRTSHEYVLAPHVATSRNGAYDGLRRRTATP